MGHVERDREIARRRSRKVKLDKLRDKYAKSEDRGEKKAILTKARKISPFVNFDEAESAQGS